MKTKTSIKSGEKLALKHGASANGKQTKEYRTWISMRFRCTYPKNSSYKWYGAKGITFCEKWNSFEEFLKDVGYAPSKKHQLDRIDSNGNYQPGNCRWVTPLENSLNRKTTRFVKLNEEKLSLSQWAKKLGISKQVLNYRINIKKMNPIDAIKYYWEK